MTYKDPTFQDRIGSAAEAKRKALDQLRSKPPVDEQKVAERQAAQLKRDAAQAEKRAARQAEKEAAEEAKRAALAKVEAAPAPPTEEERKKARDARYAARKSRK
jgi:hypothetical protein